MSEAEHQDIYSVSRLNQEVRMLLEQAFPLIWVEGEISNLVRPRSGHAYFTLKDAESQVRCALFRNRAMRLRFTPENGDQVRLRARIGLYAPRGEYQLIAEHMEPAGDGALQRAFEALKERLGREGLFDPALKRPIPALPKRIGVITSPTGAAIRDVISVLGRRFPALPILIYPVRVQGDGAAEEIASAIDLADLRDEVDVLVVGRGGGSLEDLQAFNEEAVARAIHRCSLPVISAVGHEVDIAITDLVADERAATPSAAAERLSPDGEALSGTLARVVDRLRQALSRTLRTRAETVAGLDRRLAAQHPGRQLRDRAQRLDELDQRRTRAIQTTLSGRSTALRNLDRRLRTHPPSHLIQRLGTHRAHLGQRLERAMREVIALRRARLQENGRALESVSPLATLHRGYAIVQQACDGTILREASSVSVGERIQARLGQGTLLARVEGHDDDTPLTGES